MKIRGRYNSSWNSAPFSKKNFGSPKLHFYRISSPLHKNKHHKSTFPTVLTLGRNVTGVSLLSQFMILTCCIYNWYQHVHVFIIDKKYIKLLCMPSDRQLLWICAFYTGSRQSVVSHVLTRDMYPRLYFCKPINNLRVAPRNWLCIIIISK